MERSESGKPLGLHKRSAAQCGRLGIPLAGASGRSPLERVFAVTFRQGQALRTGHKSARGVAQDVPFFTAARLERRAGALTGTTGSYDFGSVRVKRLGDSIYLTGKLKKESKLHLR